MQNIYRIKNNFKNKKRYAVEKKIVNIAAILAGHERSSFEKSKLAEK